MRIAIHSGTTNRGTIDQIVAEARKAAGTTAGRAHVDRLLGANDALPSYQKVLRREGVAGVAELSLVGSPQEVEAQLRAFAGAGATDFAAHVVGPAASDRERTWELLATVAKNLL